MDKRDIDAMIDAQFEFERKRAACYYDDPDPVRQVHQFLVRRSLLDKVAKAVGEPVKVSVEAVMNQPTAAVYERFERWCGKNGITPVGRRLITDRVKKRFSLQIGYFDTAKNEPVYMLTPDTYSHIKRGKRA